MSTPRIFEPGLSTSTAAVAGARQVVTIRPSTAWVELDVRELWEYRELLFFLVWRDLKVRYKQTVLGAAWALLQPLAAMAVFSIFFGRLARVPSDGVPYSLFAFCALLPWQFFANAVSESGNCLVNQQVLLKKVYFPRLILPLTPVLVGLVDFSIGFVLLLAMMLFYGTTLGTAVLYVPLLLLLTMSTAVGVGLWLSALNVQYRDVRYTLPFLIQLWMFATPIAYPSSLVPDRWRPLMGLNPMSGVVEGFRCALLGTGRPDVRLLAASTLMSALLLLTGAIHFRRLERRFADMV